MATKRTKKGKGEPDEAIEVVPRSAGAVSSEGVTVLEEDQELIDLMQAAAADDGEEDLDVGPEQQELFIPSTPPTDLNVKDDVRTMEFPIFTLSKRKDLRIREYSRGGRTVKVFPSVAGAANIFDKDILIWIMSHLAQANGQGKPTSRRVRVESHAFLKGTKRSTGGAAYQRIIDTCRRLKGTVLETNVKVTEQESTAGFSLIEDYRVTRSTKKGDGALEVEVTISEWMYRAVIDYDILTMDPKYFQLSQGIERRVYELARKHCGDQGYFKIAIDQFREKCGSSQQMKFFSNDLRKIARADTIPGYRMVIDDQEKPTNVVFLNRDNQVLLAFAKNRGQIQWVTRMLEKHGAEKKKATRKAAESSGKQA
ncbi:replication initiator protein A [Nitrogeniibacter aestuarii]|uniref:replication initiator protein A n=1 Tax=Nitrogeniibacter aestuarii TaxID=2815343 RepID=UPI001E3675E2|nr:replication initiator protein A [Nitrogeniibacter aestuarii]